MAETPNEAEDVQPEDDIEMTFFEHLIELRTRLIKALLGIVPGVAVGWAFRETIFDWLAIPWNRAHADESIGFRDALAMVHDPDRGRHRGGHPGPRSTTRARWTRSSRTS